MTDLDRDTSDDVSRRRRHRALYDELAELVAQGALEPERLDQELERRRCGRAAWCALERGHDGPCQLEPDGSDVAR